MRPPENVRPVWPSAERSTMSALSLPRLSQGGHPSSPACSRLRNKAVSPSASTSRRHAMKRIERSTSQRKLRLTRTPTDPDVPSHESPLPPTHQEPAINEHDTTDPPSPRHLDPLRRLSQEKGPQLCGAVSADSQRQEPQDLHSPRGRPEPRAGKGRRGDERSGGRREGKGQGQGQVRRRPRSARQGLALPRVL